MSAQTENMTDEEIAKWQEELYELERDCSTGPPMTEEEQMQRIREFLADDYWANLLAKAETRRKELEQEILSVSDPKQFERMQRNIELLSTYKNLPANFGIRKE